MEGYEDHDDARGGSKESATISRYTQLQATQKEGFFDVEEFSTIIAHYMDRFEIQEAQKALTKGLAQHPGSLELSLNKAYLRLCSGKPEECLRILSGFELLYPNNEDVLCMKAEAYGQLGDSRKGIHILEDLIRSPKALDKLRPLAQLSELYVLESRYLDAIGSWKNLLELEPGRQDALVALLHCFREAELLEEAVRYFTNVTDTTPYNGLAWVQLGESYAGLFRYAEAVTAYDYALAIDDKNLIAHYNKAETLFQNSDYSAALKAYIELDRHSPKEPQVLCGIGECLEQLEMHTKALDYFKEALAIDPFYAEARLGMAICHELLDERSIALKEMETVVALHPDNGEFWFIYAELLSRAEKVEKSQNAFEQAILLSNSESEYILGQIDALISHAEWKKALDKVQIAFEALGDTPEIYYRGIKALHILGQQDEALVMLQMLLDRHSEYKALEEFYPDIFDLPEAKELLNFP